jgi:methionyl-tRNA formyltransferase
MRIIFMGTPQFAVPSLEILIKNNYDVTAVITSPDKPAGRGQQIQQSAVKLAAIQHGINVLQPIHLKEESFLEELKALKPDLQIVVAFRMLPERVWNLPPLGTYNVHASLLPDYRGAAPINRAIMSGEKQTGITTFKLQHQIDTGNILLQEKVSITDEMNAGELHDILMLKGADLLLQSIQKIAHGNMQLIQQDTLHDKSTEPKHAPKIFKDDCHIHWNADAALIHNLIRGLSPYPGAWTELHSEKGNTNVKILKASYEQETHNNPPGRIITDNKTFLKVACSNGYIYIYELQAAGKKRLSVTEFLKGFSFIENMFFV